MSYSEHFQADVAAREYDESQYAADSYSSLLWEVESQQLDQVLADYPERGFTYLDFACGTGRVLGHVSTRAKSATGIDISEAMANRARKRVPLARVEVYDILSANSRARETFDVITSFRFLLNAEPVLRQAVLQALAGKLADTNSVLVVNNHGNPVSHKAIMAIPEWVRYRGRRRQSGNRLSHRALVREATRAGLSVRRVAGCGLLGGRLAHHLPPRLVVRVEAWASNTPLSRFCSNQMYVAKLR